MRATSARAQVLRGTVPAATAAQQASAAHAEVDKIAGVNTPLDPVQERIQQQLQKQLTQKNRVCVKPHSLRVM